MRKEVLLVSLFIISFLSIQAQQKGRIGFKAGAGYYRQNFKDDGDQRYLDFKTGIIFGLFKEIPLNKQINFQPELMYIEMGSKDEGNKNIANYIALPLLFNFHWDRVGIVVGPQPALLIKAKTKSEFYAEVDVKDSYKSVDFGAIVGVEVNFAKNNKGIAGVRYQAPLNDVWKDSPPNSFLKNSGMQAYVGFRF